MSMPILNDKRTSETLKAAKKSVSSLREALGNTSPPRSPALPARGAESPRAESSRANTPRVLRSPSFASVANPAVSPAQAGGDTPAWDIKAGQKRDSMLKDLSQRSFSNSPNESSLPTEPVVPDISRERTDSIASKKSMEAIAAAKVERRASAESQATTNSTVPNSIFSIPRIDTAETTDSEASRDSSRSRALTHEGHHSRSRSKDFADVAKSLTSGETKQAMASINAAASAAQKWGWGVIARNRQQQNDGYAGHEQHTAGNLSIPMGRGQPLPPPGTPLPPPAKPSLFSIPKRKPAPPLPKRPSDSENSTPKQPPLLPERPERRRRQASLASGNREDADELLVVEAPAESNPTSPLNEHHDEFFGHGEDKKEEVLAEEAVPKKEVKRPPPLPMRKSMLEQSSFNAVSGGALDEAASKAEENRDKDA